MRCVPILAVVVLMPLPIWAQPREPYQVGTENTRIVDASRQREIGIKFYYPKDVTAPAAVILISHGGLGGDRGENALAQFGPVYAAHGFLAINLGHRTSVNQQAHRRDRPADVSFVLDALASGAMPLPREFRGRADLERVGHAGHSWGAYTAHALGGATFDQGQFRDPRIDAIVPISPQGPDQFGSYDRGPSDNSWSSVRIPAFSLAGGAELNGPPGVFRMDRWRAKPFERYPAIGDKFLAIVPGQDHGQMGGGGSPAVKAFQADNTAAFFDVYLRGRTGRICDIGTIAPVAGVTYLNDREVESSYWLLPSAGHYPQRDLPDEVSGIVRLCLEGRIPTRQAEAAFMGDPARTRTPTSPVYIDRSRIEAVSFPGAVEYTPSGSRSR